MITAAAKAKVQRVVLTSSVVTLFGETPNPPKGPVLGPSDFNEVASMKPGDHYEPYAYGKVGLAGSKKRQNSTEEELFPSKCMAEAHFLDKTPLWKHPAKLKTYFKFRYLS